jgi:site-specific DNA-methyltransferase (adenine-specific)
VKLADWWVNYICPPGGSVLDPFSGVGSIGVSVVKSGRSYTGIELSEAYCGIARERLKELGA